MGRKLFYLRLVAVLGLLFTLGFLASCGDDSTTVAGDTGTDGQIDPHGAGDFMLGSVTVDGLPDGRVDVWAHNLHVDSDSGDVVVSFDVVLHNRSRTDVYAPIMFWITRIIPNDVHVLNSDIVYITEGPPGFDFSGELGGDDKLEAGEVSGPRTVMFGMDELQSFSIGFRITVGSPPDDTVVSGVVFLDRNKNGMRESSEPGIPGVELRMTGVQEDMATPPEILRRAITDAWGRYGFRGVPVGIHQIQAFGAPPWMPTTPNPMIVTLVTDSSGVIPLEGVNFGFFTPDTIPPPPMPIFGPVPVGPGSMNDSLYTGGFAVGPNDPRSGYVLDVVIPPILSPAGSPILMRIDMAKVWINGEPVYQFWCDGGRDVCFPATRVTIPPGVIVPGRNGIRIEVQGSEHAFLLFSVLRPDGWGQQ
jgi:hypothetical protein